MVHTAQLCPLHLTPDWPDRRSSWWRSCSPLAFVCCIGNYLKSCGALCGKRIRFNARRNAPRVPSGTSSIKVKCTCIGRHAPLCCVPPLCQHHLLRESFFNTSCIADIMKWPPDSPTDGSLPQSPWNRPLIFPSMPLSIRLPCAAITSPAFSHNIPLRAFVFPIIFARLSLFVDFYYFTWRLLCYCSLSLLLFSSCHRSLRSACLPGYVLLHLSSVMKSPRPSPSLRPNPSTSSFKMTSFPLP